MRDLLGTSGCRTRRRCAWACSSRSSPRSATSVGRDARFAMADLMTGIAAWMLLAGCWPLLVRGVRGFTRGGGAPATTGEGGGQPSAAIAAS